MENQQTNPNEDQHLKVKAQIDNPYEEFRVLEKGDKFGPNRVDKLIGEGASANVYKVWHEGLEVMRAVKILKNGEKKEIRERFLTEAKILADINHPNIVEIHNIGYIEKHVPFLEMEYVAGTSIKNILAEHKRLPLPVAIAVAYFVCQALQYAHTKDYTLYGKVYRGLIHRDIKPDNIVISKEGIVKLMDFGIARPSEVSLHTVGAKIMGTLVYLSPEQLQGTTLDHRSDIFSLGTVLYEMASGFRAFPQKTLYELVQKKSKGQIIPLDAHGVDMPKSLVEAVGKSMALEPENRYDNAAEFSHDLYTALREASDQAPQEIIIKFLKDPTSISEIKPKKGLPKALWIGLGACGLAGLATALLLLAC